MRIVIAGTGSRPAVCNEPAMWPWLDPKAEVLATGDLQWKPKPMIFEPGGSVRYIDYEGGDDANPGTRARPWKHHPWDPAARAEAAATSGVHTYVFKRGVMYRGSLSADESGEPNHPIQLTSDPDWSSGEATIVGSERITAWRRGADRAEIPEPERVWHVDLDFAPRNLWMIRADGYAVRIPLARTPNWQVTDSDDIKSEWFQFNNVFGGQWSRQIGKYHYPRHVRYYLEDKPQYLDDSQAAEFWFDKRDRGVHVFVPWGLFATVAEWDFYHAGNDLTRIPDDHFYLAPYFVGREQYHKHPTYPLRTVNMTADSYVTGPLENWVHGALQFNGKDQYAVLPREALVTAPTQEAVKDQVEIARWGVPAEPTGPSGGYRNVSVQQRISWSRPISAPSRVIREAFC